MFKKKNTRVKIVCLMLAVMMVFTAMSVMAIGEVAEVAPVTGIGGDYAEIAPMNVMCNLFGHTYGPWHTWSTRISCSRVFCPNPNTHRTSHFRERWCTRCDHRNGGVDPTRDCIFSC